MIIALVPRPTTKNDEKTKCDAERRETMTNEEAIEIIKIAMAEVEWNYPMDYTVAFEMAIEALERCEKIGSCKECDDADFCYNRKDACYCLRHNHIMYSDDTCSYFYRGAEDWSEEEWD